MTQPSTTESQRLLDDAQLTAFRQHAAELEHPREMIIDVLRAIQDNHGWVPDEGIELTAEIIGLTPLEVEEIATFYDKIFRQPVGRFPIFFCDSICCWSRGGEAVADYLRETLQIEFGQTTADGLFTLLPSCCLGACGQAPAVMIGQRCYGDLDTAKIDRLLNELRQEAAQ